MRRARGLLLATLVVGLGLGAYRMVGPLLLAPLEAAAAPFSLSERPVREQLLFDYAGQLPHYREFTQRYLNRLHQRFGIEAVILTLPQRPPDHSLESLAHSLINQWRIGESQAGRGLLLLMIEQSQEVRLEVSYALEGVFTDAFAGYVADLELGPYYRAGDLGSGLIAVMELLEERAAQQPLAADDPNQIVRLDNALLSGGGGAARALARYTAQPADSAASARNTAARMGAPSPERAWELMLQQWAGQGAPAQFEVYTEMTRLAMGDADKPDRRMLKWLDHWRQADYQVLRRGDQAVIWFGDVDGWENSPFLFCHDGSGWKFDIVWQRRLVVMAESPKWQVMQGPYPYTALMPEAWQSTAKDLPLAAEDLYHCAEDQAIAERMQVLAQQLQTAPEDVEATLELLKWRVITDQRPNLVQPLISQAKALAPAHSAPYKYAALHNINSTFQYRTALQEIDQYLTLAPQDPFAHNLKGFIQYRLGQYADSIRQLQQAAQYAPEPAYPWILMSRDHTMLARRAQGAERAQHRRQALAMRDEARRRGASDPQRLAWLERWLTRMLPAE